MTAYSDLDSAVSAFQGGAFEYLPKPFDVDQAVDLVRRAIAQAAHHNGAPEQTSAVPEILGQGAAMQEVFRAIGRLSQSHATVLINGESGTGKELVARALHRHSPRKDAPFIAINTAAIPRDLLESELFGHERAPSPARSAAARTLRAGRGRHAVPRRNRRHAGRTADPPAARAVRRHFYRVGGHQPVKANVRVIAATHQDLEGPGQGQACSARTCSTASTSSACACRPARASRGHSAARQTLPAKSARELGVEAKRLTEAALKYLQGWTSRATSGSWRTSATG
jgi:two-component system nitrogen regulation response regulator GlnG